MFNQLRLLILFSLCVVCAQIHVFASEPYVPDSLKPWKSWVLEGQQHIDCPYVNNNKFGLKASHSCSWSGPLSITAGQSGAQFAQNWTIFRPSFIHLPGDSDNWPSEVRVNGELYVVLYQDDAPVIELAAGEYRVTGTFAWQSLPESMFISQRTPVVALIIDGREIAFPKVEDGELWFQNSQVKARQYDEITLSVARKLTDREFIQLETYLTLSVAGNMREMILGEVLPAGFELIGIESDVPSFIDEQGLLHAKLKPGDWTIKVNAYAYSDQLDFQRSKVSHEWPKQEIWVFESRENIRQIKFNGVQSVDSEQAIMPEDWYSLPSYLVMPQDVMGLTVQHRGMPYQIENQLTLERNVWLSFDNSTFDFVDKIRGTMVKDWRLSMYKPFELLSAEDSDGALLITTIDDNEHGIETRYPNTNIEARGAIDYLNQLPVSGWDNHFQNVSLTLHLPPSNNLIAVFGADSVSSSWWSNWSIWSSFIVLIAVIAATKMFSPIVGGVTALTLLLIFQMDGSPLFAMFNLLLAFAAQKYLDFEKLKGFLGLYWKLSAGLALVSILFFSAVQIRLLVYPQMEENIASNRHTNADFIQEKPSSIQSSALYEFKGAEVERMVVTGSRVRTADKFERYQSDALMQAGAGIPTWNWNRYQIRWDSPVSKDQQFDLVIFDRLTSSIVTSLGLVLLLVWLGLVLGNLPFTLIKSLAKTPTLPSLILILLLPTFSQESQATNLPNEEMLQELKKRLSAQPDCAPSCASIDSLNIALDGQKLTFSYKVHAQHPTLISLPRSEFWRPEKIAVGTPQVRQSLGMIRKGPWIYFPIEAGIQEVQVSGELANIEAIQLQFKDIPRKVSLESTNAWQISGIEGSAFSGNSLTFINVQAPQQSDGKEISRLNSKPLVHVNREITMEQTWRSQTTIRRIAPAKGSIEVAIPILPGELIVSADVVINENLVKVTIPAGETEFSWRSTLQAVSDLTLHATDSQPIIEQWTLITSAAWHTETSGLPIVVDDIKNNDYVALNFYPQRGESLQLSVFRPKAIGGQSLAIDSALLEIQQGARTETAKLSFSYRSTRGGEHTIALPKGYELVKVDSDDRTINIQPEQDQLTLPVFPGRHQVSIDLRANQTTTFWYHTPQFNLNAPMSNINTKVRTSGQRWILWTSGPTLGPAVLYWGELLVFILLALLLSKLAFSPLSIVGWIILGLGLSLNNWGTLVLVAVWFSAITASQMRSDKMQISRYNGIQMLLYLLSIITILSLIATVPISLLSSPNMGIEGNFSSTYSLNWFTDKSLGSLPDIAILTLPIWVYKGLMLTWVIWLSFSLINWVKWAWKKLGVHGYWKKVPTVITSSDNNNNLP